MAKKGLLVVISGFSGAGKGTLMKELMNKYDNYALSVSATTRQPREGEVDGISYFFTDKQTFLDIKEQGGFLECAQHFDNHYGTPKALVEQNLQQGKDVLLEIEPVGALQVKEKMPQSVLIFLNVPSKEVLLERLKGRGSETEETIKKRMAKAEVELSQIDKYDFVVVNDFVDNAVKHIESIMGRK